MNEMELQYRIALTLIKDIGPITAKNLIHYLGDVASIFRVGATKLMQIDGIAERTAHAIISRREEAFAKAESHLHFIEKHAVQPLFYLDDNYPKHLKNCADAPLMLYYKGEAALNSPRIISVVGTRNATAYGKQICKQLIEILKPYEVLIVSGLAHGIDAAAHKESVAMDVPTVGVLGHGLDRIYPAVHRDLAAKMLKNGGLLTEFLPGTLPSRENFPRRNRIIAGIADATIVVEASIKGGALITAEIANSYNRDVFAFPGRINDEFSEGCNFLIKTNRAGLINHPKDLIYYLGWDELNEKKSKKPAQIQLPIDLSSDERKVLTCLENNALSIDNIAIQCNLPQSSLAMVMLNLEMKGLLVALPGKMFKRS
jgi:DNA processing protein